MNLTKQYPFESLAIGNYFTVREKYQHARVAASEYARKHGQCYTCRMQPDGTMRVIRVERDQIPVDARGARGRRKIPATVTFPTKQQFTAWLLNLAPGELYYMPATYQSQFELMQAWCELCSIKANVSIKSALQANGTLLIARGQ